MLSTTLDIRLQCIARISFLAHPPYAMSSVDQHGILPNSASIPVHGSQAGNMFPKLPRYHIRPLLPATPPLYRILNLAPLYLTHSLHAKPFLPLAPSPKIGRSYQRPCALLPKPNLGCMDHFPRSREKHWGSSVFLLLQLTIDCSWVASFISCRSLQ